MSALAAIGHSIRTVPIATNTHEAGQSILLHHSSKEKWDNTTRLIVAMAGHGGGVNQYVQSHTGMGFSCKKLVETGRYAVAVITSSAMWGAPTMLNSVDLLRTWAHNKGLYTDLFGIEAYSMNCLTALNKIKALNAQIPAAWLWAPVLDGDFVRSTAGHTPVANNGTWTTEYDTAYGSYAASAGYRVWDEPASWRGIRTKIKIAQDINDEVLPYSITAKFVSDVASPSVALRTPAITTGGHTAFFNQVDPQEVVDHFDSVSWVP